MAFTVEHPLELLAKLPPSVREDAYLRRVLFEKATTRHARHHRTRTGGLRARQARRIALANSGRCPHGVYVGGCGADYMCGQCELDPTSHLSKSQRINYHRAWGMEESV